MRLIYALLLLAFLALPAHAAKEKAAPVAEPAEMGGFEGPVSGAHADTVATAIKQAQDARIVLTGNITSSVAGEKNLYMFKDSTGEMQVVITPKQFKGNKITPKDKVRLSGKLEKQASSPDMARLRVRDLEVVN